MLQSQKPTCTRTDGVFTSPAGVSVFLAGCCEYTVPAFHAEFHWGASEFCISNVNFCEGKGPDFALVEAKD